MSVFIQVLQFVLSITLLVFLHEGGHFTFAKLFKTRVSRFYIFANWKFHLWSSYDNWFRRMLGKAPITERDNESINFTQQLKNYYYTATGQKDKVVTENVGNKKYNDEVGTEYGIGWLPIGGYCQIDGMIDETQTAEKLNAPVQPWEFRSKKSWQRLLIMAGGVMVNFVVALIIYCAVFFTWGDDYYALKDMKHGMAFNQEAKSYGFKDGDILLGCEQGEFRDYGADLFRGLSSCKEVKVLRDGKETTVNLPGEINMLNMLKNTPRFCEVLLPAEIDSVLPDGVAHKIGLAKGDSIKSIAGKAVNSWNDFVYQTGCLTDALADAKTKKDTTEILTTNIAWISKATGELCDTTVTLGCREGNAYFGVAPKPYTALYDRTHVDYSLTESLSKGVSYGFGILSGYVSDMKYLASADGAKSLGGFGTMGSLFPPVWDWRIFWMMTAFISIILAFMNIIPIPGLDGGHILFLLVEVVTRKTPSMKFQQYAQNVGMGFLLLLMIFANLNDILRMFGII